MASGNTTGRSNLPSTSGVLITDPDKNIRDYLLDLNDLGLPRVIDMSRIESGRMNPAIISIIRLIMMRKGIDPDRPDMGIDIVGRYRFSFTSELSTLESEIQEQITTYLPEFLPVEVNISLVGQRTRDQTLTKVQISITVDRVNYQLLYNKDSSELEFLQ